MRITLKDYKIPSWNTLYAGRHWSSRQEMAQDAHLAVKLALLGQKWTPYTTPVDIVVIAYLVRPIDPDNICDKLVIDGLKHCGVIPDDSFKEVNGVTCLSVKAKSNYVVIDIEDYGYSDKGRLS